MHLKFTSNKCEIPTKLQQHSTCTQMRLTEDSPGAAAKTDRGDSSLLFIPRVGGMYTSAGPIPVRLGLFETESISASVTDWEDGIRWITGFPPVEGLSRPQLPHFFEFFVLRSIEPSPVGPPLPLLELLGFLLLFFKSLPPPLSSPFTIALSITESMTRCS